MSRILLLQPTLQPPGGDRAVAVWMLEALKGVHDLTVVTEEPQDLDVVNDFYGTSLVPSDFKLIVARSWLKSLLGAAPVPLALLRNAAFQRVCAPLAGGYDVVLTADNEYDVGCLIIQYVHFPRALRPRPVADLRWYHRPATLLKAYYAVADSLAWSSSERIKRNLTLVNSDWTGERFRQSYGTESTTLYPPIAADRNDVPSTQRCADFICIGRISPEKEIERVIEILRRVRERGGGTRLRIVGGATDAAYGRRIARLVERYSDWISFHENISRQALERMIGECRYGIHGMREEHFGMGVAEMARGGCIVFVPNGGGQVEIVGRRDLLTYASEDEAVDKISRVMGDAALQTELQQELLAISDRFHVSTFANRLRAIVERYVSDFSHRPELR